LYFPTFFFEIFAKCQITNDIVDIILVLREYRCNYQQAAELS